MKKVVLTFAICLTIFSLFLKINKKLPSIFDSKQVNIYHLINCIDLEYKNRYGDKKDSLNYLKVLNEIVLQRFNHGFYVYDFSENYLLYLICLFTDAKHKGIVHPNHLAQGNVGICSQQAILCMALAEKKGYNTRAVKLHLHYVCEVFVNGSWHILDTDLKLSLLNKKIIPSAEELQNNKSLRDEFYLKSISYSNKTVANNFFNTVNYGKINTFDAPNLLLLHKATFLLSDYLWVLVWFLYFSLLINKKATIQTDQLTKSTHG